LEKRGELARFEQEPGGCSCLDRWRKGIRVRRKRGHVGTKSIAPDQESSEFRIEHPRVWGYKRIERGGLPKKRKETSSRGKEEISKAKVAGQGQIRLRKSVIQKGEKAVLARQEKNLSKEGFCHNSRGKVRGSEMPLLYGRGGGYVNSAVNANDQDEERTPNQKTAMACVKKVTVLRAGRADGRGRHPGEKLKRALRTGKPLKGKARRDTGEKSSQRAVKIDPCQQRKKKREN